MFFNESKNTDLDIQKPTDNQAFGTWKTEATSHEIYKVSSILSVCVFTWKTTRGS